MNDYETSLVSLARSVTQAAHGSKNRVIESFAGVWNRSVKTVRRDLAGIIVSNRKTRADKGKSKVTDAEVMLVANLAVQSARQNGKQLVSMTDALENAKANGVIRDDVSISTVRRVAEQAGLHPKQILRPTPHQRLRALYPNHVAMVDPSLCVLYYLPTDDKSKGLRVMDQKEFYKNKLDNIARISKERVWRYLLVDKASGAFFVKYYLSAGESSDTLLTFLIDAFCKRERDPFHGIPRILLMDKGTANTSSTVMRWLDRLGVKVLTHTAGNPRAKGAVEGMHNHIERKFEGKLYRETIRSIGELNHKAQQWVFWFNSMKTHSRTKQARYAMWMKIKPEQLVTCDSRLLYAAVESKPEDRIVRGDLSIAYTVKGYKPLAYNLKPLVDLGLPIRVGEPVQVSVNPFNYPAINVLITDRYGVVHSHKASPVEYDEYGQDVTGAVIGESYGAMPDTDIDRNRKAMLKQAYGVETTQAADKLRNAKQRVAAFQDLDSMAEVTQAKTPDYMTKKSTTVAMSSVPRNVLGKIQAAKLLYEALQRPLNDSDWAKMSAWFPDGMTEDDIEPTARKLSLSIVNMERTA